MKVTKTTLVTVLAMFSFSRAIAVLLPLTVMLTWAAPAHAGHGLPHATVTVWHIQPTVGCDPDESVEDVSGLTMQVATADDPLTIITVMENTTNPGGPCGVLYWNPATNVFRDYGFGFGFQSGIDLTRTAPPKSDGTHTYGPGDLWMAKSGDPKFLVHLAGTGPPTGTFVTFGTDDTWGCEVDQATGNVWLTEISAGNVGLLDPATHVLKRWSVGGNPYYVTQDGIGNVYVSVDNGPGGDQIVRIDPGTNTVTRWILPGGTGFVFAGFETPNGIVVDTAGNVWFCESSDNEIGRLNPTTGEICEFTKPGIDRPQLIATTGSGALRQVFFTESTGNSMSIVSEAEAVGVCTIVVPSSSIVVPSEPVLSVGVLLKPARDFVITPEVFDVEGLDGPDRPSGDTTCADGTPIPGILRFSRMPTATGGVGVNNPSGMTRVAPAETIHGSYIGTDQVFRVESCAIIAPPAGCVPVEDPDVRTQGFWKRVCAGPHPSGEHENLPGYVDCVNLTDTFADVDDVDALCDRLHPSPPNDKCEQAEAQFMALLLNICSGRVAVCNCIDDPDFDTVGEAADFIDELLSNPDRTFDDCVLAQSIADDINKGVSLVDCP